MKDVFLYWLFYKFRARLDQIIDFLHFPECPFAENARKLGLRASTQEQTAAALVRMITATEWEVLQFSKSESGEYDSEHVSGLCCITKAALCTHFISASPLMESSLCNCWHKSDERGHESLILKDWHPNLTFTCCCRDGSTVAAPEISQGLFGQASARIS